jgi:hypothetical protein
MSYEITLWCGCRLYVACHPKTGIAHSRVIERRGDTCRERGHEVGVRLALWELLPRHGSRTDASLEFIRRTE